MAVLLMFASAREASESSSTEIDASCLGELLAAAIHLYGHAFQQVLGTSRVWVNGVDTRDLTITLHDRDEVAVIPPISGG